MVQFELELLDVMTLDNMLFWTHWMEKEVELWLAESIEINLSQWCLFIFFSAMHRIALSL